MSTMAPPTEVLSAPVLAMSSSAPTPSSYSSPSSAIARNPSSSSVQPGSDANTCANPHVNPALSLIPPTKPSSSAAAAAANILDPTITTTNTNTANTTTTNTAATAATTSATNATSAANAILPAAVAATTPATSDVVSPTNATATTATPIIPTINSRPSVITTATSSPRPIPVPSSKPVHSDLSTSPSHSPVNYSYSQTPAESLRRHPTDLTHPILEECDEETCSESLPNDPVTPVSGRQSRDFRFCDSHEFYHCDSVADSLAGAPLGVPVVPDADVPVSPTDKRYLQSVLPSVSHVPATEKSATSTKKIATQQEHTLGIPANPRPIARRSSSALSRAMSSLFRRSYHHGDENGAMLVSKTPSYSTGASETSLAATAKNPAQPSRRRFSYHRSSATTRSNTPPSPASPIEAALGPQGKTDAGSIPTSRDFLENNDKKNRVHSGFSLRQRVNFVSTTKGHRPRRARSLERKTTSSDEEHLTRQPWAIPPDAGTGMKARRLSLSLPDDFTLDIAELHKEFEYQHKFLGRHGKHLGKGATSKVTLMVRKGCPGELYAAKEFRSRSASETPEEYEKKIKSEYSIAKSLHHPNVVETIRLCTDHGRWNHVMEYCSEGDLFGLVSKKYLKEEGRDMDRLCLFKQLCQGINYLHKNGIAHRDIKLENLLITKDSKLKITDFGVSEVFTGMHPGLRESGGQCGVAMGEVRLCKPGICGSLPYIAPEVLSKKVDYDPRPLDVWSSAIVMIYLVFSANLWEKAEAGLPGPSQRYYNDLVAGWAKTDAKKEAKPDTAKDAYPKIVPLEYFVKPLPLRRLLLNMLHPDPEKRITMNDVVTHRWMKNVECCQLESYDDPVKYIDASKKDCMKSSSGKIFCHNHLPLVSNGHGLPPMPGKPGY